MQVWLSYASFEATPASMLGEEEQEEDGSEAGRRQAAAEQEGPAAAADREAHARRSACLACSQNITFTCAFKSSCLMHHKWLHIPYCHGYLHTPPSPSCVRVSYSPCTDLPFPYVPVCRQLQSLSVLVAASCLVCNHRLWLDALSCECG